LLTLNCLALLSLFFFCLFSSLAYAAAGAAAEQLQQQVAKSLSRFRRLGGALSLSLARWRNACVAKALLQVLLRSCRS